MSIAITGETISYLMSLGLEPQQVAGIIDRFQRDAAAFAPPTSSSGINEERERLRNESTYAERKRAKDRERQRRLREIERQSRDIDGDHATDRATSTATEGDAPATTGDAASHASAQVVNTTSSLRSEGNPPPNPNGLGAPKGAETTRGSRLPDDWRPDEAGLAYAAKTLGPNLDPQRELDRFRDYWRAVPGAKGRKADWPATWRNWCRTAADRLPQPRNVHELTHAPSAKRLAREDNLGRGFDVGMAVARSRAGG
jgi:hypothetical protein